MGTFKKTNIKFLKEIKGLLTLTLTLLILTTWECDIKSVINYNSNNYSHKSLVYILIPVVLFYFIKKVIDRSISNLFQ
jgi:hypothetical protein